MTQIKILFDNKTYVFGKWTKITNSKVIRYERYLLNVKEYTRASISVSVGKDAFYMDFYAFPNLLIGPLYNFEVAYTNNSVVKVCRDEKYALSKCKKEIDKFLKAFNKLGSFA